MRNLVIFYPGTGGNHLANMIGASMSCANCQTFDKLTEYYSQNNPNAHSQSLNFFINDIDNGILKSTTNNQENDLWITHWFGVWQTLFEDQEKFKRLTEQLQVLVVISNSFRLSQRYFMNEPCPDDIKYQYTKLYTEQCFPNWNVSTIDFDVLSEPIEVIEAHLQDTPFHIDRKQAGPLHEKWRTNVFK